MDRQSCLGDGAPVNALDTEPGVSSPVYKCSLPAHQCWEHKAAHDMLGRGNQSSMFHTFFDSALLPSSWEVFCLYLFKCCKSLDIYQDKIILYKDTCTSVFLASSGFSWICLQCGRPGFDPWVGKIPWRRGWQPTPIFLPIIFHRDNPHGQRCLAGYKPWGRKESDMTEQLSTAVFISALFTIARIWEQPKCPSTEKGTKM